MSADRPFRFRLHTVLGILIILLGVLFTLDNLAVLQIGASLRYWPAILIVLGVLLALQADHRGGRTWGILLIFIGAVMLLRRMDLITYRVWDFWPLILVALGASLLFRGGGGRRRFFGGGPEDDTSAVVNGTAIMGGFQRRVTTQDFQGGEVTAIMGGAEIDLRNARMRGESAVLHVLAFWGGVEIRVPREWHVQLEGLPLLGGFEDKTLPPASGTGPRLVIRGTAVMGGVEVTN